MILSIRGVTIPIYLVSSTMDSIRRHVVLFKPVPIPTSDPKSEFLCQSSISCKEPADSPLNTSYAWDISHTLLRYCRNIRPTWVKFNSKDTKESEWCSRF